MKMDEFERSYPLKAVGIKRICENCGEGEMVLDPDAPVLLAAPNMIQHVCTKCNSTSYFNKRYPYVEFIEDKGTENNE